METITPWEYAQKMVSKYESYISNLQWYLTKSANYVTTDEENRINERIRDFKQVISDFKPLTL